MGNSVCSNNDVMTSLCTMARSICHFSAQTDFQTKTQTIFQTDFQTISQTISRLFLLLDEFFSKLPVHLLKKTKMSGNRLGFHLEIRLCFRLEIRL